MYSIGDVSKMFNIPISTIRYYDKKGLFINIKRNSAGIREFGKIEIETLNVIQCLKKSGMQLDDIKQFMDWCSQGDSSLEERYKMFLKRKEDVENQIKGLQNTLEFINFKCNYYGQAVNDGTEEIVKSNVEDIMPEHVKNLKFVENNSL